MKKVPGVMQVRVSLNKGLTVVDLKPGNRTTLAELRLIIKNNGFVSKEAAVVADGTVTSEPRTFVVRGTNERLLLSSPAQPTGDEWRLAVRAPDTP
jgi:copper chaperone CopZ